MIKFNQKFERNDQNNQNNQNIQNDQTNPSSLTQSTIQTEDLVEKWSNQPFYLFSDVEIIGKGGFGKVYRAFSNYHNQYVAIKRQPKYALNFSREVSNLMELNEYNHPNIIKLIGFQYEFSGQQDNKIPVNLTNSKVKALSEKKFQKMFSKNIFYQIIILELCETNLQSFMFKLSFKQYRTDQIIRKIIVGILKGLAFLEERKIVHRDLKAANILLTRDFEVKLNDFGSGKMIDPEKANQYNCINITPMVYRAPQLLIGVNQYSNKIDVWSAGCIFAEFLIQDLLFDINEQGEQLYEFIKIMGYPEGQDLQFIKNKMGKFFKIFPKCKQKTKHSHEKCDLTLEQLKKAQNPLNRMSPLMKNILSRIDYDNCRMSRQAIFDLIVLIEKMLVISPESRISAKEALNCKFCQGLIDENTQMMQLMRRDPIGSASQETASTDTRVSTVQIE